MVLQQYSNCTTILSIFPSSPILLYHAVCAVQLGATARSNKCMYCSPSALLPPHRAYTGLRLQQSAVDVREMKTGTIGRFRAWRPPSHIIFSVFSHLCSTSFHVFDTRARLKSVPVLPLHIPRFQRVEPWVKRLIMSHPERKLQNQISISQRKSRFPRIFRHSRPTGPDDRNKTTKNTNPDVTLCSQYRCRSYKLALDNLIDGRHAKKKRHRGKSFESS